MKRINIISVGSRGDVQPYIALGQGLQRAGHSVRLVTNADFTPLVKSYGLDICPVDIKVEAMLRQQDASAAIERGGVLASFRKLSELASTSTALLVRTALDAAQEADLLISGFSGMLVAASLAEKLHLPLVQAYNVPLTPTSAYPGALLPWLSFPPHAISHQVSHRLTRQLIWQVGRSSTNAARRKILGLPPAPATGMDSVPALRNAPLLYGFSPAVLPRPAEWEDRIQVTGYWFADEPGGWTPPAELAAFLERGPAPVYIGFGSMSSEDPAAISRLVLEAVALSGRRAVVHSGWAGLSATSAPENVLIAGSVPHSWLFPAMAATVHHGGAGTTAAALAAGAPQVVVPFHGDQPFWARLTEKIGVGTRPIPRKKLTAERLAAAIEEAVSNAALRQRAGELGRQVSSEDGMGRAVEIIQKFVG
jgi:sterol 3beta-glucosyltransferase